MTIFEGRFVGRTFINRTFPTVALPNLPCAQIKKHREQMKLEGKDPDLETKLIIAEATDFAREVSMTHRAYLIPLLKLPAGYSLQQIDNVTYSVKKNQ